MYAELSKSGLALLFIVCAGAYAGEGGFTTPSRSTTIALTSDDNHVVVVNRQGDSVSIIEVRDAAGSDSTTRLAEIRVGDDPRFVAITPDDQEAYVTNAADGTVSVIDLGTHQVTHTIDVGDEPRGIAITPHGAYAFVALHTEGEVAVISTDSKQGINTVRTGGNPQAIVITKNGNNKNGNNKNGDDDDERVFATLFFSQLIDPKNALTALMTPNRVSSKALLWAMPSPGALRWRNTFSSRWPNRGLSATAGHSVSKPAKSCRSREMKRV